MDEHDPKPADEQASPSPPEASELSERQEEWRLGDIKIVATFATRHGIEVPWATRVRIESPDIEVSVVGRNSLATAFVVAEALQKNPIID